MFKSTAAVLGFLFAISTAYYLSFWGYFEINALQYISAGDIVKGVAYPLRFAGIWIAGMVAFAILVFGAYEVRITYNTPDIPKAILVVLFTAFIILSGIYLCSDESMSAGIMATIGLSLLVLGFHLVLNWAHKTRSASATSPATVEHPFAQIPEYVTVFSAVFLSANAILSGQIEARRIHSAKDYNYVLSQDLQDDAKTDARYLIFLGAISEKYIFLDPTEREHFVVDKGELPVLRVHHFTSSDTLSSPKYKILQDSIRAVEGQSLDTNADQVQAARSSNQHGKAAQGIHGTKDSGREKLKEKVSGLRNPTAI